MLLFERRHHGHHRFDKAGPLGTLGAKAPFAPQDPWPNGALRSLLDVPGEDTTWQSLDPSQRRQRTLDAIKRLLLWETRERPLLLVVENLHWIDGETQAVLDSLVEALPTARLLLLVSYRPEYQHTWGSKTYYTQLRLDPLPPKRAQALLVSLLGQDTSLTLLTPRLIEQTEGNPFFIEESVRALVETRVLAGEPGAYRLAKTVENIHVPTTVHLVLAARIDFLPSDAKHLLQAAAVVGKEVPFSLLQTIVGGPAETLRQGLAHLQRSEFLYERSLFSELVYTFKHALTHEVAYTSLLSERRRVLHARVAEAFQSFDGDRLAMHVERLAHHALRGEVWEKALVYCRQAGEKAMACSAHREAVSYLEQALSALPHLPETCDTRAQAIDLQLALCSALAPSEDSGRILACLREAESLAEALDDPPRLGQALIFLSRHFRHMGAYDRAIAAAERALKLATAGGDDPLYPQANLRLGYAHRAQGDCRRAIDYFGRTVAALDYAQRSERLGQAILPAVSSRAFIAACHAELGTFAEGRALGDEGLYIAQAVAHPPSLMFAAWGVGLLALRQGDLSRALPWLEQSMSICQDTDLPAWFPLMAATLGAAYASGGRVADAMPLLTQAMEQTTARATVADQVLCCLAMGEAQALAGRLEDAYVLAGHTLALTRRHQERGNEAYALRLLGETAAQRDPPEVEPAEDNYRQALTLAKALGMGPLIAHCRLGLGALYVKIGYQQQADRELYAAVELYRAMDMTFWLPHAEAALARQSL